MGWSFSCNSRYGRKAQIEDFRRPGFLAPGYEMLQSQAVGNNFWYLCKGPDNVIFIGLNLMGGGGRQNPGWGYKGLTEDMGPVEVNCPISYLDKASPPRGYAAEWREKVRAYHARRAVKFKPGMRVEYGGHTYRLQVKVNKGWHVVRESDYAEFLMRTRHLNRATILEDKPCDTN